MTKVVKKADPAAAKPAAKTAAKGATKAPVKTAAKAPVKAAPAASAAPKTTKAKAAAPAAPAAPAKVDLKGLAARVHDKLPLVAAPTVAKIVEATFAAMTEAYANGDVVNIKDFGKLYIVDRPARTGRNPQTGQPVEIAARRAPKFAFAKALKELV